MPSGLSQSHQEIAGQFQWELLQLICLGSGGQRVQRPPPRGMGRPIGLQWRHARCTHSAEPSIIDIISPDWIAVPLQFFYAPRSQRCF